jgi:hypothetical protein
MKIKIGKEAVTVPFFIALGAASDKELNRQFHTFLEGVLAAQARGIGKPLMEQRKKAADDFDGLFQSIEKISGKGRK